MELHDPPRSEKQATKSTLQFPIVGIGASAGGMEAFKKFIRSIPETSGMAYIFVQHLAPSHLSVLPELLQKGTTIPIHEITDNIRLEPDHIFIIPPNKLLLANDGILELSPRPSGDQKCMSIDLFFTSLAEVHETHAVGIVLSGTGTDGTLGLKAIKEHGGITFAEDEASAAFEGMPNNAVQAGVVDFVLPPEEMYSKIADFLTKIQRTDSELEKVSLKGDDIYKQILTLVRVRKGTDFTYYKQTTIRRRILRRIALNKIEHPEAYLQFLRDNKGEQDLLHTDLLIPVTSFFRDPKVFSLLCESVFPAVEKNKGASETIRIWIAGCSTGQEAYSVAICLREFLGDAAHRALAQTPKVQIFATDISEQAISKARTGVYTKAETEGLSPQRLQEFFTKIDGSYQLNKSIRDSCVFAVHNFLKDPPFAHVDLVSCRNVLIYMESYLQKKALTAFHYALNQKSYLLLGKAETTTTVSDLFTALGKSDKLFIRKDVPRRIMHTGTQKGEKSWQEPEHPEKTEGTRSDFQKNADDILLSRYTPAGVVVNEVMDIVHFRGNTAPYLQQGEGKPSHNLLRMAKEGLSFELRTVLFKAKAEGEVAIKENIAFAVDGVRLYLTIEAIPLRNTIDPHYLVLFHQKEIPGDQIIFATNGYGETELDLRNQQLERELLQLREDIRSITEEQEAANEELQSANEELLSGSEELQSLNEELETSKEELQSTNEELTILNQEMLSLNEQLREARSYAEAIVTTIREPLVVLDANLRVRSANYAFYRTFRILEEETEGKLIYELGNSQWNIPELRTALLSVFHQHTKFTDFEVTHNFPALGTRTMRLNAREMLRENGEEKLLLLAIDDVTEKESARRKIEESNKRYHEVLMQSPFAFSIMMGAELRITVANNLMKKIWGKGDDIEGQTLLEILPELAAQDFPKNDPDRI